MHSMNAKPGLYIRTFGCQMNEYDSSKLAKLLEEDYTLVQSPEKAGLILVNTCSVREKPEQKLYSLLGQLRPLKEQNPDLIVGVGGCVAQQEGKNIVQRSRVVDFVFGTHNLSLVPSLVKLCREGAPPQVAVDYRDEWEDLPCGLAGTNRITVPIAVSRGCNCKCSYCIVPVTRGPEISRHPDEIEREAFLAVRQGAKEVVLLGQNVNSYGGDLSPKTTFAGLLNRISLIEDLARIRFISPHPREVRRDFIDLFSENLKVCRHIHLPLQSGSNAVLRAMRRNYRREKYIEIVDELRARIPDISFTTDIIVGFPGETDGDFQETLEIMEYVQFDSSYSFMFSPRPGTPAAAMAGRLPEEEKLRRLQLLQKRQEQITSARLKLWLGKNDQVLLEGPSPANENIMQGRLSQNIMVHLDKPYKGLEAGIIADIEIFEAGRHSLRARLNSSRPE